MSAQKKSPIWWEKSVEYQFVMDNYKYFKLISPFDGGHESAGDAAVGADDKFVLIEFKKNRTSQKAEFDKFKKSNPKKTEKDILDGIQKLADNKCHFIVYAEFSNQRSNQQTQQDNQNKLALIYINYYDYLENNRAKKPVSDFSAMMESAISLPDFFKYLKDFQDLKSGDINGKTSSTDFANVLILDSKGSCLTYSDFKNKYHKHLQIQQSPNKPERQEQTLLNFDAMQNKADQNSQQSNIPRSQNPPSYKNRKN